MASVILGGSICCDDLDVVSYDATCVTFVDTIADLRAASILNADHLSAVVGGNVVKGDGAGDVYVYDPLSTAADNGRTVINPAGNVGSGRWVLVNSSSRILVSNPLDQQPLVYSAEVGMVTNALIDNRIIVCVSASSDNIDITNPPSNISNVELVANQIVFLFGQTNPIQNGPWKFNGASIPLTRPANYFTGKNVIAGYVLVQIAYGDFDGDIYQLTSPSSGIVDTDATTWTQFTGEALYMESNTFVAGPSIPSRPGLQGQRALVPMDLAPYANGDDKFEFAGRSIFNDIDDLGSVEGYWSSTLPWENHSALINRMAASKRVWFDQDEMYFGLTVPVPSNKVIYAEAPGSGRPASIVLLADIAGLTYTGTQNVRVSGNLHIRYRVPPVAGTAAIRIVGTANAPVRDLYFERVTLENCADGISIGGNVDNVVIDHLVLKSWSGTGIITTGTDTSNRVTNVTVRKITWMSPRGSTTIVASATDFTGNFGIPGLTIESGSGSGEFNTYVQDATTANNAPINCSARMTSTGATGKSFLIFHGLGRTILEPVVRNAIAEGIDIGTGFTGNLLIRSPVIVMGQVNGIRIRSTGHENITITDPRVVGNSQASAGVSDGIRIETGVNNFYIRGGVSGDTGTNTQRYGLNIVGTSTFFEIDNLDVHGNLNAALINNANAAGTWSIRNCRGFTTGTWTQ